MPQNRNARKDLELREAENGVVPTMVPTIVPTTHDPDLARLVAVWHQLPDAIRAAIAALVQASGVDESPTD
jgi:hypothetical protein